MVKLQLLIAPNVTGYVHVQTNPKLSFSTAGTINNAKRMFPCHPRRRCRLLHVVMRLTD